MMVYMDVPFPSLHAWADSALQRCREGSEAYMGWLLIKTLVESGLGFDVAVATLQCWVAIPHIAGVRRTIFQAALEFLQEKGVL